MALWAEAQIQAHFRAPDIKFFNQNVGIFLIFVMKCSVMCVTVRIQDQPANFLFPGCQELSIYVQSLCPENVSNCALKKALCVCPTQEGIFAGSATELEGTNLENFFII